MIGPRLHLRRPGGAVAALPGLPARTLRQTDARLLAELMVAAYRGTIDDEGEDEEAALAEIDRCFSGNYGPWLERTSLGFWRRERLESAVIMTLFEGDPFFAFCMTRPEAKRQGLCRRLMLESLALLDAEGCGATHLVVTAANTPAVCLYTDLGFRKI